MEEPGIWHWVITAVFFYVTYLLVKRRKPAQVLPTSHTASTLAEAELVINAYGKTLEYLAPVSGSSVADELKLPFPKARIKAAILVALHVTPDKDKQELLKVSYLALADFQPQVGSENIGLELAPDRVAKLSDLELLEAANSMSQSSNWLATAATELTQLIDELRDAGYAVKSS